MSSGKRPRAAAARTWVNRGTNDAGASLESRPDCAHLFDDDEDDESAEWWELATAERPTAPFRRPYTNPPERLTLNTRARKEVEVRQKRGKSEVKTK